MFIEMREDQEINRQSIREGLPETVYKLRDRLRREGIDTGRRLALDLSKRGFLRFRHAGSIVTPHTHYFRLVPRELTPQEKYLKNLREMKAKGKEGKYLR